MGMGSNKKRSSAGVVVSCVVLALALLTVEAAGTDRSVCSVECSLGWRRDYARCMRECIDGAVLLADHEEMGGEKARGGAVDALTAADAVDALTIRCWCLRYGADGACQEWRCRPRHQADLELTQTKEEVEETKGGAVDALMAADALKHCIRFCERRGPDGRCKAWRCRRSEEEVEETREEAPSRRRCEAYCSDRYVESSPDYTHCLYTCPRLGGHGVEAGGRGAGQEHASSA